MGGVGPPPRAASTRAASSATVGASKSARTGTSAPSASRTRDTTRVARSECPPSAKKSSPAPTRSTPSTSAQIPASTSCVGVRGASDAVSPGAESGAGRARRSTLPLGVSGNASRATKAEGTMYSGSRSRRKARSSPADGAPEPVSTIR